MIPCNIARDVPESKIVAQLCATFVWDTDQSGFVRVQGCDNRHDHLIPVRFDVDKDRGLLLLQGVDVDCHPGVEFDAVGVGDDLALLQQLSVAGLLHIESLFDDELNAIHIDLRLLQALCDDRSPAHSAAGARNPTLQRLAEFLVPGGGAPDDIDMHSDHEADISAFLDSIRPPSLVPELAPIPGLQCSLLPFQARAVSWALDRERRPPLSSPSPMLDVLYEAVDDGLFVDRRIGRFTTIPFADPSETIRGGMLCQTMGLGKTVEQIALILMHTADSVWLEGGEFMRRAATMVVCPQALLGQWRQEVGRHAPALRVVVIFTVADFPLLDDPGLDVVLVSYETLRQQHVYQSANQARRTSRRRRSGRGFLHPVPLLDAEWWRVVLDEAQRITGESGVTRAAQLLKARHRWVVSGTPICRRLQDLAGLLRFFGHPLGARPVFERVGTRGLRPVLAALMYRHDKDDVQDELGIPPLDVDTVHIQLSDLEHIKYSKMMRRVQALQQVAGLAQKTRMARLCHLLLQLRKTCCCPFLVDGQRGDALPASEALPILEIKKRIEREAELEVDLAQRQQVRCLTQLATTLAVAKRQYARAETLIGSALAIAEDALNPFLSSSDADDNRSGTRLEHVRTLAGRAVLLECLGRVADSRQMLLDCFAGVDAHLGAALQEADGAATNGAASAAAAAAAVDLPEFFADCSARFSLAVFRLMMGRQANDAVGDLRRLQASIAAYLSAHDADLAAAVGESAQILACLRGRLEIELKVSLHRRALFRDLIVLRVSILDCLLDLVTLAVIDTDDGELVRDRQSCKALLDALPMGRNRAEVGFVGADTAADSDNDNDCNGDGDNFHRTALGENRAGFRLDADTIDHLVLQGSIMTGLLRTADKLHLDLGPNTAQTLTSRVSLIAIVVGREPAALSSRCCSWMAAMFAALRTGLYLRQMLTDSDEDDAVAGRCWERCFVIREELRNLYRRPFDQLERFFEEVRAGKQDAVVADLVRAEADLERAESDLRARQNELRYITQKFAADPVVVEGERVHPDDDHICPICRTDLQTPVVTPCGHIFCSACLSSYMLSGHSLCPLRCRNRFQFRDCLRIDETSLSTQLRPAKRFKDEDGVAADPPIQADYGAKITDLLRRLFEIRRQDPSAKSLVFSQWTDLLNVVRMALDEHGIGCVQLRGDGRQKALCVEQFLNSASLTVFLIPMAQGASGLTMVAARHAFIMEPGLNPTLEDQAINRIHRIGQRQATRVIRYIAKGTVEEPIAEIQQRHRTIGYQAQKAFAPEVFDEFILNDIFQ